MNEKGLNMLDLIELQFIDNYLLKITIEINKHKVSQKLKKALTDYGVINEEFEDINNAYKELEHERKRLDDALGLQTDKIKDDKDKMFSGTITSSKDLENMQEEVKILTQKNDELENQILEIMDKIDEKKPSLDEITDKKEKVEKEIEEIKKEIRQDIKKLEDKIGVIKERREKVVSRIPEDTMNGFRKMKSKKGGIAIAYLKDNICSACNMEMSAVDRDEITETDKIYNCPVCGRMLIVYRNEIDAIKDDFKQYE